MGITATCVESTIGSCTLVIALEEGVAAGDVALTVQTTVGALVRTLAITLHVVDFQVTTSQPALTGYRRPDGAVIASVDVTVTRAGVTEAVDAITVEGAPGNVNVVCTVIGDSCHLQLFVLTSAVDGAYPLVVAARIGNYVRSTALDFTIEIARPIPQMITFDGTSGSAADHFRQGIGAITASVYGQFLDLATGATITAPATVVMGSAPDQNNRSFTITIPHGAPIGEYVLTLTPSNAHSALTVMQVTPISADANELLVSDSNTAKNGGTDTHPFKTFTHAMSVAASGDTVSLGAGTYHDGEVWKQYSYMNSGGLFLVAQVNANGINIQGSKSGESVIDGPGVMTLGATGNTGYAYYDCVESWHETQASAGHCSGLPAGSLGRAAVVAGAGTSTIERVSFTHFDRAIVALGTSDITLRGITAIYNGTALHMGNTAHVTTALSDTVQNLFRFSYYKATATWSRAV